MLALLVGCGVPADAPRLPAALRIPRDTPEAEREAWEEAAASWNAAAGRDVIALVTDSEEGCGIHVAPGDHLVGVASGRARIFGCDTKVMVSPVLFEDEPWALRVTAEHELGHVLRNDGDHSDDPGSVMYGELLGEEQAIRPADVAAVLARMPGGAP